MVTLHTPEKPEAAARYASSPCADTMASMIVSLVDRAPSGA